MKFTNRDGELVIVGATSASMVFAAQLLAYGIHPIIIDDRKGLPETSERVTLDRKSVDTLAKLGLLDPLSAYGYECEGLTVQADGKILKRFDFCTNLHTSVHTSFLYLEQYRIDKALLQYLGSQACPVYWDSAITDFNQHDNGVTMAMLQAGSRSEIKTKWVVLSDNGNAIFTRSLNVDHKTWTFNRSLFQSEMRTEEQVNRDIHLILSKRSFTLAKPLNDDGAYHLVSALNTEGATRRRVHAALASVYRVQRCILLGVSSFTCFDPVKSSLNIQFRDASNLSWKLAMTILGKTDKSILTSYEQERKPMAVHSFNRNYWLWRLLFYSGKIFSQVRLQLILKSLVKQLNTEENYRRSSLSLHHSLSAKIKAGDWLPNLTIYDENKGVETSLHEWTEKTGFVLLLVGSLSSHLRFSIRQWVKQKYSRYIRLYYLPYSSKNNHIFEAFEVNADQHRMILIRPDGYIAFINDTLNASLIDTYMEELIQWKY